MCSPDLTHTHTHTHPHTPTHPHTHTHTHPHTHTHTHTHTDRGAAIQRSRYLTALHRRRVQTHIPDSNHTVIAGQNLTLYCNASFFTLQQWIKDQGGSSRPVVVSNTPDGRIFITSDFQLQFRGISLEDAAMYRCSLRNDLSVTASIIANVEVVGE